MKAWLVFVVTSNFFPVVLDLACFCLCLCLREAWQEPKEMAASASSHLPKPPAELVPPFDTCGRDCPIVLCQFTVCFLCFANSAEVPS